MSEHPLPTVAVVGASGVLGRTIARHLADAGYHPFAFVRDPARVHDETFGGITRCDVCDAASVQAAFAGFDRTLAGIVIASGVVAFGALGTVPSQVVDTLFATNATGVQHVLDAAATAVADDGFVVNLTGVAAEQPLLEMSAYCASKAAASMSIRAARRELRRRRITAIDARPGHTETGLTARALWGTPPKLPQGLEPDLVAARIVAAIAARQEDLPPAVFTSND